MVRFVDISGLVDHQHCFELSFHNSNPDVIM